MKTYCSRDIKIRLLYQLKTPPNVARAWVERGQSWAECCQTLPELAEKGYLLINLHRKQAELRILSVTTTGSFGVKNIKK